MRKLFAVSVAALASVGLVACSDGPMDMAEDAGVVRQVVLTEGIAAPVRVGSPGPVALSGFDAPTFATLGGSTASPVTLTPNTCDSGSSEQITITFSVSGNQAGTATFKVKPTWTYDGSTWVGSGETVVTVPPQSGGDLTSHHVQIAITNSSAANSGASTFDVETFDLENSNTAGAKLDGSAKATVHVAFTDCAGDPDPPTLTLPSDLVVEATSSAGAAVNFSGGLSATDHEGTEITADIVCTPASGSTFAIGATEVECSVTDSGGRETNGSFFIYVQDTTAPVFTAFPSNTTLIAANINGAVLDLSSFTITAEDKGPGGEAGDVSGPVSIECKVGTEDADGYEIGIGDRVDVDCTATDNASFRAPDDETDAPNSHTRTFEVTVGLDLSATCGFGTPLRNVAPWSAHKRNSAIPHKICPPAYDDGTLATDLAAGLKLALAWKSGSGGGEESAENPAAGSTQWRYDADAGHYIFNAKTANNWALGTWETTVSYAGLPLATTFFVLNK